MTISGKPPTPAGISRPRGARLRVLLALIARKDAEALVVDDIDQIRSEELRQTLLDDLVVLSHHIPTVVSTVNSDPGNHADQAVNAQINGALDQAIADLENVGGPAARDLVAKAREAQAAAGISVDPQTQQMADTALDSETINKLKELRDGARELSTQLNDPAAQYLQGINKAADGAETLSNALKQLHDGSGQLVAGTAQLTDGTETLVVGVDTAAEKTPMLVEGTRQLIVGVDALNDGTGELALKINQGAEQVPRFEGTKLDDASSVAASPVRLAEQGDELSTFGKGLSPFFLSLSLWFGGLIIFMIYNPISRRAIDSGVNPARVVLGTWIPAVLIGLMQALILWICQVFVLKVDPVHPVGMLASLGFISMVFVTSIVAINAVFGPNVGRLLTMVLMTLQLVASNGVYPPEVQPKFIQWLHSWDPMRFSVDLMRHALFDNSAGDPRLMNALAVLAFVGVASFLLAMAGFWRERVLMEKDIHPELEV